MLDFKYLLILLLMIIGIAYVIEYSINMKNKEGFETSNSGIIENTIIQIYADLLKRNPSTKELIENTRLILGKNLTYNGLRIKIIDSEEYDMFIKMQNNDLVPELPKMLSDRSVLNRLGDIYKQEKGKVIDSRIELPLKDLFTYFDYSEGAVRALLRDPAYDNFEKDVINIEMLDKETLIDMFNSTFDLQTIIKQGVLINKQIPPDTDIYADYGTADAYGMSPDTKINRSINDTDTNMTSMINDINNGVSASSLANTSKEQKLDSKGNPTGTVYDKNGNVIDPSKVTANTILYDANGVPYDKTCVIPGGTNVYDATGQSERLAIVFDSTGKCVPANMIVPGMTVYDADGNSLITQPNLNYLTDATTTNVPMSDVHYTNIRLPTHRNDMVLLPEMAWSVPNYRPPVCTTLGQKPLTQPMMDSSKLLLGTPLDEDTQVGTIMPKFTYGEYISVPV